MKKYSKKVMLAAPEDLQTELFKVKQQEYPHLTEADLLRLLITTGLESIENKEQDFKENG